MIKSMTGYGKANLEKEKRKYQIEIKSVNHRYSDISIKMPRQLAYLEEPIKRKVSEKVKRGKIDIFITFENEGIEGKEIKINTELASGYIKALKELAESIIEKKEIELAEKENILADIQVNDIAKYPDVLNVESNNDDETVKQEILETVELATANLVEMRKTEGLKMAEDIEKRLEGIQEKVNQISRTFYWTY